MHVHLSLCAVCEADRCLTPNGPSFTEPAVSGCRHSGTVTSTMTVHPLPQAGRQLLIYHRLTQFYPGRDQRTLIVCVRWHTRVIKCRHLGLLSLFWQWWHMPETVMFYRKKKRFCFMTIQSLCWLQSNWNQWSFCQCIATDNLQVFHQQSRTKLIQN